MMTVTSLEQLFADEGVYVASIWCPQYNSGWRVNLRDGPGWVLGPYADTLEEALNLALVDFRKEWSNKKRVRGQKVKVQPVSDDLGDLLG